MRCRCCDKQLTDKEVIWNEDLQDYELCTYCLDAAIDAAYSDPRFRGDEEDFVLLEDVEPDQYSFLRWFQKEKEDE